MRFILPLVALAASVAAIDNFEDAFIDMIGECGGKCMASGYEKDFGCGDPSKSSSNACYCGLGVEEITNADTTDITDCIMGCKDLDYSVLSDSDTLLKKLAGYQKDLCGSTTGTSTASSSSTDSSSSDSPTGGAAQNARRGLMAVGFSVAAAYLLL